MRYEEPKMYISMFDDEDEIITSGIQSTDNLDGGTNGITFGLGGSDSASGAAASDTNGATTYSIDVKTFN